MRELLDLIQNKSIETRETSDKSRKLNEEERQSLREDFRLLLEDPDNPTVNENLRKWFKEKWVRFGPDGKIRGTCARGDDSEGKPKCLPQSKAHSLGKKGRKYAASKKRREDPNPERKGKAINVATKRKTSESELEETHLSTMRDYFSGNKNASDPTKISQMRQYFSKQDEPTSKKTRKEFRSNWEYQQWLNKNQNAMAEDIEEDQLDEACWKGYHKEGMKTMFGKKYPNCVKNKKRKSNEGVAEDQLEEKWSKKYKRSIDCDNPKGFSQRAHCQGRKKNESVEEPFCPQCGGELVSEDQLNEKKDACYSKVKSRYKVWPSGALVKCRKVGAKNWGSKSK